jgi:hypothetical protein
LCARLPTHLTIGLPCTACPPALPVPNFTNKKAIFTISYFYNLKVLFTSNFTIFKLRSTAGQMPALVIVAA